VCEHEPVEERLVELPGIDMAVAESGVGGRPFLLLHGFTGAKEDFSDWLDPLADAGWHAVAPDHRGHGASTKPDAEEAYSFDILADDAMALVDALGWDRFALLGHSMGGMVAQLVATRAPERLDALVLMDTTHGAMDGLDPELVQAAVSIVRDRGMNGLADILATADSPLDSPAHKRILAERPGYAAFEDRKFRATSAALYAAMAPAFSAAPERLADLASLPSALPCLVIVGEQDVPMLDGSREMAATIPHASLEVIPEAGHTPQFENSAAWWDALSSFLAAVPAAAV
jgi:3-oxoadipate enol-lactonase